VNPPIVPVSVPLVKAPEERLGGHPQAIIKEDSERFSHKVFVMQLRPKDEEHDAAWVDVVGA
jgi:hypothetical protein